MYVNEPESFRMSQGSVLGPVLFILYVNDICTLALVEVTIKLFADDTKLYTVFSDRIPVNCLQSCLTAIFDWSQHWQLKLSPSNCSVMQSILTFNVPIFTSWFTILAKPDSQLLIVLPI